MRKRNLAISVTVGVLLGVAFAGCSSHAAQAAGAQAMPDGIPAAQVGTLIQQWEPGTKADNLTTWAVNPSDDNGCTGGRTEQQTVGGTKLLYLFVSDSDCTEIQSPGYYNQAIIEARIYLRPAPNGKVAGWPAFWLANQGPGGWPYDGEIDVAEAMEGCIEPSYHGGTMTSSGAATVNVDDVDGVCDATPGWHVVSIVWTGDSLTWRYDGKVVATLTNSEVVDAPEQIIFSATCGGSLAEPCAASGTNDVIQYVRVWLYK